MASPELEFRDFIEEASSMRRLAVDGGFINSASDERLSLFREQIERAKVESSPDRPWPLEISKDTPVRTRPSRGEYQPNKDEDRAVFGELATRWHIRPTGTRRKTRGYSSFVVDSAKGATTSVSVWRLDESGRAPGRLALWHSDIRPLGGLGCCFHTQVLGDSEDPPFPAFLDLPRFPDPFITPMAVLEFLLGELFPKKWRNHVTGSAQCVGEWRDSQKKRWQGNLDALRETVLHSDSTPWVSIRSWSPS